MDYLQYMEVPMEMFQAYIVLNLIINGLPSIQKIIFTWIFLLMSKVLNLIINGLPSIHRWLDEDNENSFLDVLNLIINGLPSILQERLYRK